VKIVLLKGIERNEENINKTNNNDAFNDKIFIGYSYSYSQYHICPKESKPTFKSKIAKGYKGKYRVVSQTD
jgi:hypothetical protein